MTNDSNSDDYKFEAAVLTAPDGQKALEIVLPIPGNPNTLKGQEGINNRLAVMDQQKRTLERMETLMGTYGFIPVVSDYRTEGGVANFHTTNNGTINGFLKLFEKEGIEVKQKESDFQTPPDYCPQTMRDFAEQVYNKDYTGITPDNALINIDEVVEKTATASQAR